MFLGIKDGVVICRSSIKEFQSAIILISLTLNCKNVFPFQWFFIILKFETLEAPSFRKEGNKFSVILTEKKGEIKNLVYLKLLLISSKTDGK